MYKLKLDEPHIDITKKAFESYFNLRNNNWKSYIQDITESDDVDRHIVDKFKHAYLIAAPDYLTTYDRYNYDSTTQMIDMLQGKIKRNEFIFDLTELSTLLSVIEEYMRMRMGQYFDFTDDVACNGWRYDMNDKQGFDDYISRRNDSYDAFNRAYCNNIYRAYKIEQVLIAEDIYDILKHQIYKDTPSMYNRTIHTWSYPLILWSNYKQPEIEIL